MAMERVMLGISQRYKVQNEYILEEKIVIERIAKA